MIFLKNWTTRDDPILHPATVTSFISYVIFRPLDLETSTNVSFLVDNNTK